MKTRFGVVAVASAVVLSLAAAAADIKLPPPKKTGGPSLLEVLDKRCSAAQTTFPAGAISEEDLSTILWAASGLNRNGNKWTVPMAKGVEPYCTIYVVSDAGVYRYEWKEHTLVRISTDNVKASIPTQTFAQRAPLSLYFVVDGDEIKDFSEPLRGEAGPVLAGGMSQNVYLACEALGIGTRMIYSVKRDVASRLMKLDDNDLVLFALPMGKR